MGENRFHQNVRRNTSSNSIEFYCKWRAKIRHNVTRTAAAASVAAAATAAAAAAAADDDDFDEEANDRGTILVCHHSCYYVVTIGGMTAPNL